MSSSESLSMVILISVIALTSIGVNNELSSSKFHVLEERSMSSRTVVGPSVLECIGETLYPGMFGTQGSLIFTLPSLILQHSLPNVWWRMSRILAHVGDIRLHLVTVQMDLFCKYTPLRRRTHSCVGLVRKIGGACLSGKC